ncbi:Redoxin [Myriangium duriaei CBS 260.36]|uniref:Redoxin n=1 Tax=Myriangium duriaei CBS 260.36 TaxID=1168546 RepID=A0A9P4J0U8_9PEZI|nr:Redoxin [Myriangium duriaei CBS 260.36]
MAQPAPRRAFHASRPAFVKVGDSLPSIPLMETSPGNTVNLAEELSSSNGIVIGVPGAFTPSCSAEHVPGYIKHPSLKNAGKVFVVGVHDPFVMGAWGATYGDKSGIRFLADPKAEFTKALELDFEGVPIFQAARSKRYALVVENGKVKEAHVEPDNTGVNVSAAEKVLGA